MRFQAVLAHVYPFSVIKSKDFNRSVVIKNGKSQVISLTENVGNTSYAVAVPKPVEFMAPRKDRAIHEKE